MMVALASTYLTVMGAKCALPSVLPLLTSRTRGLVFSAADTISPQSRMATLLGMSTLAIAFGKLSLGPVIDALGGINSLKIALSLLMVLLTTISLAKSFALFAICWIAVDFIFSSCWASCINAIHQSFPEKEWGKQIGILAVGARTGNTLAFAMFSSILRSLEGTVQQPWRHVFAVSAILQLVPLSLVTYFGKKTLIAESSVNHPNATSPKPSFQASLATIRREASTLEFWLHLLSRSVLMVFASFLLFVPTLMSQVYGTTNAIAAQGASLYSLGCLLSVTFGSSRYSKRPKRQQALATLVLMTAAVLSSLFQLAHVTGFWTLSATASAATMFLWGFAFSIPFYLPPSLYALSRGGRQSSATIADALDIGGFLLLALFNGYVASIEHANPTAWIPTFLATTTCSMISLLSLPFAILRQ
jgi:sugar phosphate permease